MSNNATNDDERHKRVGIIGGGQGGTALLQALSILPQVKVVGVCDIDPQAPRTGHSRPSGHIDV